MHSLGVELQDGPGFEGVFLPVETGIASAGQKSNLFFLTQLVLLRRLDSQKKWYRYSVLRLRFTLLKYFESMLFFQ